MKEFEQYYPKGWEFRTPRQRRTKLVQVTGVNDATYATAPQINGKRLACPAYRKWNSMLKRVNCPKLHARYPTYIGTSVCEEWLSFMAFREWFFSTLSKTDMAAGEAQLDKDLLTDEKIYSPRTCLLIPQWLNNLTTDRAAARGDLPIGVSRHGKGFRVDINLGEGQVYLGAYPTPAEAAEVYKKAKLKHVRAIELPGCLPKTKIRKRLIEIVKEQT